MTTPERSSAAGPAPLPTERLRWLCDPAWLDFDTTDRVPAVHEVIGQETAVDALRFGLATSASGHHIFVRGLAGTGRITLVRKLMEKIRPSCPRALDRCFVRNFDQPDRPRLISLRRGCGPSFVKRMQEFGDFVRERLGTALNEDVLKQQRTTLETRAQKTIRGITDPFEVELKSAGLGLVAMNLGEVTRTRVVPVLDGEPVPPDSLDELVAEGTLTPERVAELRAAIESFSTRMEELQSKVDELQRTFADEAAALLKRQVLDLLEPLTRRIVAAFATPEVESFVSDVLDDITERRLEMLGSDRDFTRLYRVNLVAHHPDGEDCAVITEITPSMPNLLGTIDQEWTKSGAARSDHMMIRAGSLLRADGGFLLLEARDLLSEPGAWKVLVRTLRTGKLDIVPPELASPFIGRTIKPEPVDINVKVVLIGDSETYYLLDGMDPDFPHLFKVLADFESTLPRSRDSAVLYAGVVARIAEEESLPSFDREAVARLVEHGARIAARAGKVTARFGRVCDVAREAAFVAAETDATAVDVACVREAIDRGRRRANLPSRRFRELINDGTIRVRLEGAVIGQVNGLAVVNAGPLTYGFPQRITATVAPGGGGFINIDREAKLSGAIHTKGFYILAGLLRSLLRVRHPLTFDASIAFEQSYGGIDGDSASGAEMCSLISALTAIPIRQDLAITGAIDQTGQIMAIGAVNEKIEGFYDACADAGLTGTQGCLVPATNAPDLMLREDVVEAAAAGRFHVYAVETINEALTLLLDRPAGVLDPDTGTYEPGTVLALACERAHAYWDCARPQVAPHRAARGTTTAAQPGVPPGDAS